MSGSGKKDYLKYTVPLAVEEGKARQGRFDGVDPVLGRLVAFWGDLIRRPGSDVQDWMSANSPKFASYTKDGEHELSWKVLHGEYQALLDKHLDDFVTSEGLTVPELFDRLKVATLDPAAERVIGMIQAGADYDVFLDLMVKHVSRAEAKLDDRPVAPAPPPSPGPTPATKPPRRRPKRRSFGQSKPQ